MTDWARAVVYLREHDPGFRSATVVLTGSSAFDLAASADLLHGRRGRWSRHLDRLHMPMSFRDYVAARNEAAVPVDRVALVDLLTSDGREAVRVASLRSGELDQYLGEYIRSGGLPAPVTDLLVDGRLAEGTAMELWRGLSADARRLSRNDLVLRKLISRTVVRDDRRSGDVELLRQGGPVGHPGEGYADRRTGKDYESMTKAFGRGIMVARRDLDVDEPVLTIPAGVLLALLG